MKLSPKCPFGGLCVPIVGEGVSIVLYTYFCFLLSERKWTRGVQKKILLFVSHPSLALSKS
jgi:hypothetical protein